MIRLLKYFLIVIILLFIGWRQLPSHADVTPVPAPLNPSQTISLDYTDASLTTVLKSIAYSYNLNLVISNNIAGKVSAQLKDISLDEALNALLGVNGYGFSREGTIVYIMPKSEMGQVIESVPLSYLSAKEAQKLLSKALSSKGDIQINEATNSLVIMDYPQDIKKIKDLIKDIDTAPIQVLIEARIVDIQTKDIENIGTAINATFSSSSGVTVNTGSSVKATDGGQFKLAPKFKNLSADLTIDALVQKNKAHVLASPSIATLNGQEARIIIGERYPYTSSTSVTGSTATTSTAFVDVGTTLRVTPTVSPDGWITMKVHPEVSSVMEVTDAGPQIKTREADAMVRVKDNETIIIGGLISKSDDRSKNGVPVLRSVPVLGWFFQRHSSDQRESELIVFITPHIIRSPQESPADQIGAEPKVYIDPKSLDKGTDMLSGLWDYVKTLEESIAKKPSDSLYLNAELIKTYNAILRQFPHSGKGDLCLYKMCRIYVKEFGKCEVAQSLFKKMKRSYPDSPYLDESEFFVNACLAKAPF